MSDALRAEFPELYKNLAFGFECCEGWFLIIFNLSASLVVADPTIRAEQVKQKFGTLRFDVNHVNEETEAMIEEAERFSAITCEFCGRPGVPQSTEVGWVWCLCERCRGAKLG